MRQLKNLILMGKLLPNLKSYLEAVGVTEETSAVEREDHKKRYRQLYHRHYARQRRQDRVRLENTLTKAEYRKLKGFAQRYKQDSLNRFVLDCAFSYLEKESMDHDPEQTLQLIYQIRAIGNNINQVVHGLHRTRNYVQQEAYRTLQHQVNLIEQKIENQRKITPCLKSELEKLFAAVPESIADFENFLVTMKAKHLSHDSKKHQS